MPKHLAMVKTTEVDLGAGLSDVYMEHVIYKYTYIYIYICNILYAHVQVGSQLEIRGDVEEQFAILCEVQVASLA